MRSRRTSGGGFTLVELLIVIAIIGILAAVLIPNLLAARTRAYDTATISCAKSLQNIETINLLDHQVYAKIGAGPDDLAAKKFYINSGTNGVNPICGSPTLYVDDRSSTAVSDLEKTYTIDLYDTRGSHVYTITPSSLSNDDPNAIQFSSSGANGTHIP